MTEEESEEGSDKGKEGLAHFVFGSNAKGGSGMFKFYFSLDKPIDDIEKDLTKYLKVLAWLQREGYALPNLK